MGQIRGAAQWAHAGKASGGPSPFGFHHQRRHTGGSGRLNLGTAATYFFKAARLAEQAGTPRPEYEKLALGICDFALRAQLDSGEFAKSWFMDGTINAAHGSVGAFMILLFWTRIPLPANKKYADCALRAFAFYYGEFAKNGFTTAGALDSYCIDKESAAPLLRGAGMLPSDQGPRLCGCG